MTIVTSVAGLASLVGYFVRLRYLLLKTPFYRPIGSRRGAVRRFSANRSIVIVSGNTDL